MKKEIPNLNRHGINSISVNLLTTISMVFVLISCAAGPNYQEYSDQLSPLSAIQTRLYIYRPESSASGLKPEIIISGRNVGRLGAGKFLVIEARPGGHVLTTSANPKVTTSAYIHKGKETYIRLDIKRGLSVSEVKARIMDSDIARSEIAKTTYSD